MAAQCAWRDLFALHDGVRSPQAQDGTTDVMPQRRHRQNRCYPTDSMPIAVTTGGAVQPNNFLRSGRAFRAVSAAISERRLRFAKNPLHERTKDEGAASDCYDNSSYFECRLEPLYDGSKGLRLT